MAPLQAPEYIRALIPYVPGKPIEETRREYGLRRVIKLASNENPLGSSPKALAGLSKARRDLHRYPDASGYELKQALASHNGVRPGQITLGNGSEEVIDLLIRTYCVPGDAMVTSRAAFLAYKIAAQIQGVSTLEAPLREDLRFDLPAMALLVRSNPRVRIVFIANPNNPTGTYVTTLELRSFLEEIAAIRRGSVLVALDSAYWEYVRAADLPDPMELGRAFPNVVVLRTFSKIYGLAGLRAGYGLGSQEVISTLEKVRKPFNMNSMAMAAAQAALSDRDFVRRSRRLNERAMAFWEKGLHELGIPFWPSQGNFILADVGAGLGKPGLEVYEECLKQGVILRPVTNYGLPHALRISMGTPEENRAALRALRAVRAHPAGRK